MVNKVRRGEGDSRSASGTRLKNSWRYEGYNGGGHAMSDCLNDGSPRLPPDKSGQNMSMPWSIGGCTANGVGIG